MAAAADQTKLKKRLEALLKLPENSVCADCNKRGPRWASANLGCFFCIECSGIHRNLGVHISFVRSVNLDTWTPKQVEFMEEWGNARANAYYEANLPPHVHKPKEGDTVRVVEKFIRDKYEHKRFIASSIPPPMQGGGGRGQVTPSPMPSGQMTPSRHNDEEHEATAEAVPVARTQAIHSAPVSIPKPGSAGMAAPKPIVTAVSAPEVNLLDFSEPVSAPPAAAAPQQAAAPAQQSTVFGFDQFSTPQSMNEFSEFQSATATPSSVSTNTPTNNGFGNNISSSSFNNFDSFGGGDSLMAPVPPAQAAATPPPAKPQASADSILSLFGSGGMGGMGQQMQYPQMGYGGGGGIAMQSPYNPYSMPQSGAYPPQQQAGMMMYGGQQVPPQQQQMPQGYGGYAQPQPQQGYPQQQGYNSQSPYGGMPPQQNQQPQMNLGYGQQGMGQQWQQQQPQQQPAFNQQWR